MADDQPVVQLIPVEPKSLHPLVFLAIYCAPMVFVWLLLRKGYSPSLRQAGFIFAFFVGVVPFVAALLDSGFRPR